MKFTLRFTREYLGPLAWWYTGGAVAILLTNYLSVRIPMELAAGLDALQVGVASEGLVSTGSYEEAFQRAIHIAILGVVVIGIRTLSRTWFFTPARIAEYNLREALFHKAMRLQPPFYAAIPVGDLLTRCTSDISFVRAFAGFGTLQVFNVLGAGLITIGQMLAMSPLLTVACVVPIVVVFLFVQLGIRNMMQLQRDVQVLGGELADRLLGTIQGVGTIQGFCVEGVFEDRLLKKTAELREKSLKLARLRAVLFPALGLAGGVAIYGILALGAPMALDGTLSAGKIAAFVSLSAYLLFPMMGLGFILSVLQRSETSLERIYKVLDTPIDRPELQAGPQPFPCPGQGPAFAIERLSFGYTGKPILHELSAVIPAGKMTGIFGRTGSGKTTLLRVLSRLINPQPGQITLHSPSSPSTADLMRLDLIDWRQRVTLVAQTPFLFSESIAENVGSGLDLAQRDPRVAAALDAAQLGLDLAALPDGPNTIVGERGIVLSGGQRQRVALARGLARDPEVMLLDDVLSAVDHRTEALLIDTLTQRAAGGKTTTVVVSHRLSVLERCDQVLVMDEGRVVDSGTHTELIARPGLYRDAWEAQAS